MCVFGSCRPLCLPRVTTRDLSAKNRALVEPKAREAWAKAADAVLAVRAVPLIVH